MVQENEAQQHAGMRIVTPTILNNGDVATGDDDNDDDGPLSLLYLPPVFFFFFYKALPFGFASKSALLDGFSLFFLSRQLLLSLPPPAIPPTLFLVKGLCFNTNVYYTCVESSLLYMFVGY